MNRYEQKWLDRREAERKGINLGEIKFKLQQDYRTAMDKALTAKNPEDLAHWAAKAAVAISELQHPSLSGIRPSGWPA